MGIPQRSLPGPLSMYTNDLPLCVSSVDVDYDMFADGSSLTASGKSISAINIKLQTSL